MKIGETEERMAAASQNVKNYAAQHIAAHLDAANRGAAEAKRTRWQLPDGRSSSASSAPCCGA